PTPPPRTRLRVRPRPLRFPGRRRLYEVIVVHNVCVSLFPAGVQHLLMIEEEVPPELSLSLDQEEPKSPNIKEEQEELWTSQEGEQLPGLEEADGTKVPLTPVHVKSEDDEEKPQSSQPHRSRTEESREAEHPSSSSAEQMETEADGEDCGGSEPDRNLDPHVHTVGKSFDCSVCGKRFKRRTALTMHTRVHTGERPFGCDVCGKRFKWRGVVKRHMNVHTGEKPFGCSVCGKRFNRRENLKGHTRVHTKEKLFSCSFCGYPFTEFSR
uniref:C2H2-type domain-containing protein n=1 Tax=Seriola dumerili TaxID=41447 RepID=A0A3B4VD75_SERDU